MAARSEFRTISGATMKCPRTDSGRSVSQTDLCFATLDHVVSTAPGRPVTSDNRRRTIASLRDGAAEAGIRFFDIGRAGQGIVHVIGPELGISLPGSVVVCADSRTCTHGGVGAMGFEIGSTEAEHVLATQTIVQAKLRTMRITFVGELGEGVTAKDLILAAVGQLGAAGGNGYAVEYAGNAMEALDVEARLTLCNLSIELGEKVGMVAPDEKTFGYLSRRQFAPRGELWSKALAAWRDLPSDPGARFDAEVTVDIAQLKPKIAWGTSPAQVIDIDGIVPETTSATHQNAAQYMDVIPGQALVGLNVDLVFVGSCNNSRISDLRIAAAIVRGRKVADHVSAWMCPAPRTSSNRLNPRSSIESSRRAGSNGANQAARCAWPRMAKPFHPALVQSRGRTGISSAARGRAHEPIWPVLR